MNWYLPKVRSENGAHGGFQFIMMYKLIILATIAEHGRQRIALGERRISVPFVPYPGLWICDRENEGTSASPIESVSYDINRDCFICRMEIDESRNTNETLDQMRSHYGPDWRWFSVGPESPEGNGDEV